MANEVFDYGTAKTLTANAFTKSGYTFSGWATTASGAVAYTDAQSISNLSATDGATVNLYAVWTDPKKYMVVTLSNGAIEYFADVPSGGWTVDPYKQTKMAFVKVNAGTFNQTSNDGTRKVTLTKSFYMSIHSLTSHQCHSLGAVTCVNNYLANMTVSSSVWPKNTTAVRFVDWIPYMYATLVGYYFETSSDYSMAKYNDGQGPVYAINKKTGKNFKIPTEAQLTLARSVIDFGSSWYLARDMFNFNLGTTAVTDPVQEIGTGGYPHYACVNQTSRGGVKLYNYSFSTDLSHEAYVRFCLLIN